MQHIDGIVYAPYPAKKKENTITTNIGPSIIRNVNKLNTNEDAWKSDSGRTAPAFGLLC